MNRIQYFFVFIFSILLAMQACIREESDLPDPNPVSTLTDPRNGQVYKTVKLGERWWMAENLNVGKRLDSSGDPGDNGLIEKYCYNNDSSYFGVHGGLYTWTEAMDYSTAETSQGICPDGWHVPSEGEWQELLDIYPDCPELRAGGKSGFESLMSGSKSLSSFTGLDGYGVYWTSTKRHVGTAVYYLVNKSNAKVITGLDYYSSAFSVRCIRDTVR